MPKTLSGYEKETIITFNEAEDVAHVFTYNKTWQQHLEKKLNLAPLMDNEFGGKEYKISKKRIRPPLAPRKLSAEAKKKLQQRARELRQNSILASKTTITTAKSRAKSGSRAKSF